MPPKKTNTSKRTQMNGKRKDEDQSRDRESESIRDQDQYHYQESSTPGTKRKSPLSNANTPKRPTKASQLPINNSFAIKVVKFFLSPKALHLLENQKSDAPSTASNSAENDYFSLSLNPFEHVLCALILSKSLSHALGQRTVRMDLNSLYKLSNTKAMLKASKEEAPKPGGENGEGKSMIWQAIEESRTQHQQRTVTELRDLAKTVEAERGDEDGDGSLKGLLGLVRGKEEGWKGS